MDSLKSLRKAAGRTQQQMASLLGVTQQAYAAYENNRAQPPLDIARKLADYFGVSVDYLLGRDITESPPSMLTIYPQTNKAYLLAKDLQTLNDKEIDELRNYLEFIQSRKTNE